MHFTVIFIRFTIFNNRNNSLEKIMEADWRPIYEQTQNCLPTTKYAKMKYYLDPKFWDIVIYPLEPNIATRRTFVPYYKQTKHLIIISSSKRSSKHKSNMGWMHKLVHWPT